MADVLFLALTGCFSALTVLLVRACDSIIGPDPMATDELGDEPMRTVGSEVEEVAS